MASDRSPWRTLVIVVSVIVVLSLVVLALAVAFTGGGAHHGISH